MCEVSIVTVEPSDSSPRPTAATAADAALLKLNRAKTALADATVALAALEEQPFPWKEAKNDEGVTYFYDESSEESVHKLPPEDAAIYSEKKRLAKVIQSAKTHIESARKVLGAQVEDGPAVTAAESVETKANAKLPLHLQKAKDKIKSSAVDGQHKAGKTGSADGDGGDTKRLQKVKHSLFLDTIIAWVLIPGLGLPFGLSGCCVSVEQSANASDPSIHLDYQVCSCPAVIV